MTDYVANNDAFTTSELDAISGNLFADNGSGADSGDGLAISEVNGNAAAVGNTITLASGALLTVNSDGSFAYDPNGAFEYTPTADSGASNTPSADSFTYTVAGGGTATVNLTVTGVDNNDILLDTVSNDSLTGGDGNDEFVASAGDDYLDGGNGQDLANYGPASGPVTVNLATGTASGAAGNDTLVSIEDVQGTPFDDVLIGDDGNNVINAGLGNDLLDGAGGDDNLMAGEGNDTLLGGAGNDQLLGYGGDDQLDGGAGRDIANYYAAAGGVTVDLGLGTASGADGNDTLVSIEDVQGSTHADILIGDGGNNLIAGADGNDRLIGGGGNDDLYGQSGNDYITGSLGDDTIDGGDGIDRAGWYTVNPANGGTTVSLLLQGTAQYTGSQGWDTLSGIENLSGTPFADSLTGDDGDNWLWGSPATIIGVGVSADNNDYLDGQGGNDLLTVGIGNHTLIGGSGVDTVRFTENGGTETGVTISLNLQGGAQNTGNGSWTLTGIENLSGGTANDNLTGNAAANTLAGDLGADVLNGNGGDDLLLGDGIINVDANGVITTFLDSGAAGGNDSLNGGNGNDTLYGGAGLDGLSGGAGNDSLYAGDGNDFLSGGVGDDLLDGGAGSDRASFFNGAVSGVTVDLGIVGAQNTGVGMDTLVNVENVSGTSFADTLTGDGNDNWLWGSGVWNGNVLTSTTNDDTIDGGGGNDLLTVGQGNHVLTGGDGIDTVSFSENTTLVAGLTLSLELQGAAQSSGYGDWTLSGIENLSGSVADDSLTGDGNANVLAGSLGNDQLSGGGGDDILYGDGDIGIDFQGTGGSGPIVTRPDVVAAGLFVGAVPGDDELEGGLGDDQLWGGGGNDILRGNEGNDLLYGGDGSDILKGQSGDDLIDGGAGTDRAGYYQADSALGGVTVSLQLQGTAQYVGSEGWDTLVSIENVFGTPFVDILTGDDGDNWLSGSEATIEGIGVSTTNNDTLDGQGGNDLLSVGFGNHTLIGGSGIDTVQFTENGFPEVGITIQLFAQGAAQDTGAGMWTLTGIENLSGGVLDDSFEGDGVGNVLAGDLGNDTLFGYGGDDLLLGDGRISVDANGVITTLLDSGAAGGNDLLFGGAGNDTEYGGAGSDSLYGGAGDDSLHGGIGNDFHQGAAGNDLIDGGDGIDRASFYHSDLALGGVTVSLLLQGVAQDTGAMGIDTLVDLENISGTPFADTLTGDENNNWLWGSTAWSLGNVISTSNDDTLDGQGGDDLLTVGVGNHTLIGGSGIDTLNYTENGGTEVGITIDLGLQDIAQNTGAGSWTLSGIENLAGGTADDSLTGDGNANLLAGNLGSDILTGGAGNDTLLGDGSVFVDANQIINTPTDAGAAGGDDTLEGGDGDDQLYGGAGSDTATYASAGGAVTALLYDDGSGEALGAAGYDQLHDIENLAGSAFNDTLIGNNVDNVIDGGTGHDFLRGNAGNDTLLGGEGDDYLDGGAGDDILDGGAGFDRLSYFGSATGPVTVDLRIEGVAQDTGQGMDTLIGIEHFGGTVFGDTLTGNDGDNWIRGSSNGGDADTIDGQGGDDLIEDGAGDHVIQGGAGTDTFTFVGLVGGSGINVSLAAQDAPQDTGVGMMTLSGIENLSGSGNADTLTGDGGDNILAGSGGNDSLAGGAGSDQLYGDGQFTVDTHGTNLSGPIILQADSGVVGDDVLDGGLGNDLLDGGGGSDTASYASASGGVQVDLGFNTATGAAGNDTLVSIENVTGSQSGDVFTGNGGANVLDGLGGNDSIAGGAGDDVISGGDGDDFLQGDFGDGNITASGNDIVSGGNGNDNLRGGLGNDQLYGGANNDLLRGNGGVDYFDGGSDDGGGVNGIGDRISFFETRATQGVVADLRTGIISNDGYGNVETMVGIESLGGDTAYVDTFYGNDVRNYLSAGRGDYLYGFGGDDVLQVAAAAAVIDGGSGIDRLVLVSTGGWLSPDTNGDGIAESMGPAGTGWNVNLAAGTTLDGYGNSGTVTGIENVIGSSFNDSIFGDGNANLLEGGDGNDRLISRGGDDLLYGGSGNDILKGEMGDDLFDGGAGIDRAGYYQPDAALGGVTVSLLLQGQAQYVGSEGWDTLVSIENVFGTPFADVLTGDAGDNWLQGSEATIAGIGVSATNNDMIDGGGGNDMLQVGIGNHTLIGGIGTDTLFFSEGGFPEVGLTIDLNLQGSAQNTGAGSWTLTEIENLSGGQLDDELIGDGGVNALAGDSGNDTLIGGAGNDLLYGDGATSFSNNILIPGFVNAVAPGNDILEGGDGDDQLYGGAGSDTASYASASGGVSAGLGAGGSGGSFGADGNDTFNSIENLTGSAYNDQFGGNADANVLSGGDGHDIMVGRGGNDTLIGGNGDDYLRGDDAIAGDDILDGGSGWDRVAYNLGSTGVTVDLNIQGVAQDTGLGMDTLISIEHASGSSFNDILIGSGGDNWLRSWGGDDVIYGNGGNDLIETMPGNNVVDGGSGIDSWSFFGDGTFFTAGVNVSLALQSTAQDTGQGMMLATGFENLSGTIHDDILAGDGGDNVVAGDLGNDTLSGGAGNDVLYGDGSIFVDWHGNGGSGAITQFADITLIFGGVGGNDTLDGGLGDDLLDGSGGSDTASYASAGGAVVVDLALGTATGAAGNDTLVSIENVTGSAFDDMLSGNAGDNFVDGGLGEDIVQFSGNHDDYLASEAGGVVAISGADSGTDSFVNVEIYRFADGDYAWDSVTGSLLFINDGIVADGYVAGATIFIDIDHDGTFDSGIEPFTISDANGNFTLLSNAVGPLRAVGGTNIDTGLANVLTLSAPEGSSVINPLTTLVEALVAGGLTEAAAEDQVLSAFGLDPTLDLTTFDILAAPAGDAAALEAQKAAASVAEILETIVEAAGAGGGTAAQAAGVASLAGAVSAADGAGETLDLTDNATLTDVLTDALPELPPSEIAELAAATEAANTAIDEATDIGDVSDAQGNAAPTIPAIDAGQVTEDAAAKTIDLLTGAQDADGDTLSVATIVSAVTGAGQAVVTSLNGNILSIDPAQFNALAVGEGRTVTVTYRISDGHGGLTTNTATLVVNGVNDGPAAANDSASAVEDSSVAGNVRSNDSDPDTADVTVVSAIAFGAMAGAVGTPLQGLYGTLTLNANGTYSYAADADYLDTLSGVTGLSDVFSYTISDGQGGTSTATLTVNVSLAADERTINGTVNADIIQGDRAGVVGAEDTIFGGKGGDQLFGHDGADTLWGGGGDDSLSGGQSRDTLYGEDGNDTLNGGSGNDWIQGGGGNDRLTGGTGADTFAFAKSGGADTITDFQSGVDHIKLDGVTVKSSTFSDVDRNGTLDLVLQLSSGSVTLLNVSTPLPASTFVTTTTAARTAQEMSALSASIATNTVLLSAVAATGLMSAPAAAHDSAAGQDGPAAATQSLAVSATAPSIASNANDGYRSALSGETRDAIDDGDSRSSSHAAKDAPNGADANGVVDSLGAPVGPTELLQATESNAHADLAASTLVADGVAMPSAEMLLAAANNAGDGHSTAEVARVLAEALGGGGGHGNALDIDTLLSALPGQAGGSPLAELAAGHAGSGGSNWQGWDPHALAGFTAEHPQFDMAALALHQDALPVA